MRNGIPAHIPATIEPPATLAFAGSAALLSGRSVVFLPLLWKKTGGGWPDPHAYG